MNSLTRLKTERLLLIEKNAHVALFAYKQIYDINQINHHECISAGSQRVKPSQEGLQAGLQEVFQETLIP